MTPPIAAATLAAGLVGLLWGAHLMVEHAVHLGRRLGLSTVVIGATIVAFGTSAPEFVVSMLAGITGHPGIAVGNVVGSNISNLALVLGAGALMAPFAVQARILKVEYAATLLATVLAATLLVTDGVSQIDGLILAILMLVFFGAYLRYELTHASEDKTAQDVDDLLRGWGTLKPGFLGQDVELPKWEHSLFGLFGLGMLMGCSQLVVNGATELCRTFGISEAVIGATVVALGTSLPELATTVAAARRGEGEGDLILGNVLGSNLFNLLFVLGPTAMVTALPVTSLETHVMVPLMLGVTLLPLPFLWAQRRASRLLGGLLLGSYVLFLVLSGTSSS